MAETTEDLLAELKNLKAHVERLQTKVQATRERGSDDSSMSAPGLDELREIMAIMLERQNRMESSLGVEKVSLKDIGDRVLVTIDTNYGSITTHADKAQSGQTGTHSPVTYSGSTVAGTGVPAPGVGGGKGGGPAGMTPDQLQEFKKQSLQIGAAQQKLKELETKLTDATVGIKKGVEKTTDMEEKQAENIKELYACLDNINSSLSEKIALQKVEVQKIAGDTPKPINYDPFNYGEAYAGDLVDFQARKRITELKLLMQSLQAALLQMRDSMKISPSIDLGYKVVRLDQLVGSTGFGQKVNNGEVGPDEALLVEQSGERVPAKVEYPRKSMNQTSPEMESKWAITDSIMQTMYRLEMELGDIQKIVDSTGLSSGSKVIEEVQQSIKQLKDRQIDIRTIKRLIEDSKESSVGQINLMSSRKSVGPSSNQRNTLPQIHGENSESSLPTSRKMDATVRQLQNQINAIQRKISMPVKTDDVHPVPSSSVSRKGAKGKNCLSCDRSIKPQSASPDSGVAPTVPLYPFFNPNGQIPRARGPVYTQLTLHRSYKIEMSRTQNDQYHIPRACGGGYREAWPLPKTFDLERFKSMFEQPNLVADTKYIKGSDGHYYRGTYRRGSHVNKREVPMTVGAATTPQRGNNGSQRGENVKSPNPGPAAEPVAAAQTLDDAVARGSAESEEPVAVLVQAASDEDTQRLLRQQEEEEEERRRHQDVSKRASQEMKKYKVKLPTESVDMERDQAGQDDPIKEESVAGTVEVESERGNKPEEEEEEEGGA